MNVERRGAEIYEALIQREGGTMPYISIEMFEGRTAEQKKVLIQEVTKTVTSTLGIPPEAVWIVIKDVPRSNWGERGKPCSELYPEK